MRRYRTFIAFAVISILAFYHFSGYASWSASSAIGAGSLKHAGILPINDQTTQKEQPGSGSEAVKEKEEKEKEEKEKEEVLEYTPTKDPLHEEVYTAATPSVSISSTIKDTWTEEVVLQQSTAQHTSKIESAPTKLAADRVNYDTPVATDPPTIPEQQQVEEVGQGRHEVSVQPTAQVIHWSKQPEHFPVSSTIQLPSGTPKSVPRIQHKFETEAETEDKKTDRVQKLKIIRDAAARSWKGYRDNAWKHDEVRPVTGGSRDPFCGWAATMVDALDTLWIMGMKDDFEEAVMAIADLDFTTSPRKDIPLFETTIRYLGGLLSAYDVSGAKYPTLLDKAVELAEVLMGAFDTPNRMPMTFYHWMPAFASQPHRAGTHVVMAEIGSLSMEFTRLAQITKESRYYDAIDRVTDAFYEWQQDINGTLVPGLFPTYVDASGCEKPAQMKTQTHGTLDHNAAWDDTDTIASKPVQAKRPASQDLSTVKEGSAAAPLQAGKVGKIVGWGDPIEEGSLDSKTAKEEMLRANEEPARSPPKAAKAVGNMGKLSEWQDPPAVDIDAQSNTANAADPRMGNMGKIGVQGDSIGEGLAKRQLGGELAESNSPTSPSKSTSEEAGKTKPNAPALSSSEICIPRGLASSARTGTDSFTMGGMADSTYEYLPKQYLLLGGLEPKYRTMYENSMDAAIDKLLFRPMTPEDHDILFSGEWTAYSSPNNQGEMGRLKPEAAHLTCFAGAMFAMGSKIFDRKEDLEIGSKLTEGCVWAYNATATGIMPELALLSPCDDMADCKWNETKYWEQLDPYRTARTRGPTSTSKKTSGQSNALPDVLEAGGQQAQADTIARPRPVSAAKHADDNSVLTKRQSGGSPGQIYPNVPGVKKVDKSNKVPTHTTPLDDAITHEEYVQARIQDERLPAGFMKINSRKYILRLVYFSLVPCV